MLMSRWSRTVHATWSLPRRNISCSYKPNSRQHHNKYHNKASPSPTPTSSLSDRSSYTDIDSADSIMTIPPMPSSPSPSSPTVKTRILIISDTHNTRPQTKQDNPADTEDELSTPRGQIYSPSGFRHPLPEADVALHCGDLTRRGSPAEVRETFSMLRKLRSPLKLVIAGNHDLVLDEAYYCNKINGEQSEHAEVLQIVKEAEEDSVQYLTEGTYTFNLSNGARLRIFASPYTPEYGSWAFQYIDGNDHSFDIPSDVDIAMTHGPPLGVLDRTSRHDNAGCGTLFRSIYRAKPKIHCFGHIHEAWGAQLMQWKPEPNALGPEGSIAQSGMVTRSIISPATVLDWEKSRLIYTLSPPPIAIPTKTTLIDIDTEAHEPKHLLELSKDRGCYVDLTEGENMIKEGEQTLFVNASIMSIRYRPTQMPWVIDLDLPRATESDA
ncbi:Metallo-dependent phosphatase-like protein [Trichoderma ceciliae]